MNQPMHALDRMTRALFDKGPSLMRPSTLAQVLAAALLSVLGGCAGDCEFTVIASTEECPAECATFKSEEVPEALICTAFDCTLPDNACELGQSCVAIGTPVCLFNCKDNDDCPNGLTCVDQPDAITSDSLGVCFFPD